MDNVNTWIDAFYLNILNGGSNDRAIFDDMKNVFESYFIKNKTNLYELSSDIISTKYLNKNINTGFLALNTKYSFIDIVNYFSKFKFNSIDTGDGYIYYNENTIMDLFNDSYEGGISINLATSNKEVYDSICKELPLFLSKDKALNKEIYTMTTGMHGLELISMGSFKKKLIEKNYNNNVLNNFKESVKEINKKNPVGRLTILHGPPGTGKTYLLRSIINMVKDGMFIFVQPEVFSKFGSIDLVKALSNYNENKIILLVEDADSILVDRSKNNEDLVSSILNLTDGFAAEFLNLHIIATTNLPKIDLDKAYKRNGRLNKFIELGPLSAEEANIAYNNIKRKNKPKFSFKEPAILADIYSVAANNIEFDEVKEKKRKIGFIR